jgi:hypothetical protein
MVGERLALTGGVEKIGVVRVTSLAKFQKMEVVPMRYWLSGKTEWLSVKTDK